MLRTEPGLLCGQNTAMGFEEVQQGQQVVEQQHEERWGGYEYRKDVPGDDPKGHSGD